jgi:tetratricopeptide (TPR) repeat protein
MTTPSPGRRPRHEKVCRALRPVLAVALLLPGCTPPHGQPGDTGLSRAGTSQQQEDTVEATSLLGRPLRRPALAPEVQQRLDADLALARQAWELAPGDADAIIWLGRRLAYLGRYREALDVFTLGIDLHPRDARMYRHRGHRWITVRELGRAVADLERAAALVEGTPDEVEPDGAPNRYNIPRSTLHSNIWYHLALAYYLRGELQSALPAWQRAVAASTNDDMFVAAADWLYMTWRRLGRVAEAAQLLERIRPDMEILENETYHRRLLMYKGMLPPEALLAEAGDAVALATQGYGVGNWYRYNGHPARAREIFEEVLRLPNWAAFGFIAAEAALASWP